jgi:hypothetical protein
MKRGLTISFATLSTLASGGLLTAQVCVRPPECVRPPAGMVSWWPGDGNARDIHGTNNATLVGASFAPGMVLEAFRFPGGSRAEAASAASLQITGTITLDAWVSYQGVSPQTSGVSNAPIVAKWGDTSRGTAEYGLFVYGSASGYPDGTLVFSVSPDGTTKASVIGPPLPSRSFTHVAGVWNGSQLQLYVNGVLAASAPFAGSIVANQSPLVMGGYDPAFTNVSDAMVGLIDEVEIFNRALSAAEIQSIVNAASAGKCKSFCQLCDLCGQFGL